MTAGSLHCLPRPVARSQFPGLLIEFKTETGEASDEQKFFLQFFADLGYRTAICRNEWTAAQLVNEHLGIKVPSRLADDQGIYGVGGFFKVQSGALTIGIR
jgi:hypothetical protein